jgi:hypothetical protein
MSGKRATATTTTLIRLGQKQNRQRPDQKQDLDPNVKIGNNCTITFLNHEPSHAQ